MNSRSISFVFMLVLILSGCTNMTPHSEPYKEDVKINVLSVDFDSDYKCFYANVQMNDSITGLLLNHDTTIHFQTREFVKNLYDPKSQPRLKNYENLKIQELAKLNLNILILADLTLDSAEVAEQQRVVRNLKNLFVFNHLHIAFMKGRKVTETMEVTDYVLDNYFKAVPDRKYLYRSILSKIDELEKGPVAFPKAAPTDTLERGTVPGQNVLIVFSDGKVYDNNRPLDPDYFSLQHQLSRRGNTLEGLPIFYVNLNHTDVATPQTVSAGEEETDEESQNFLTALCQKTGGKYLDVLNQNQILNDILSQFNKEHADYRFTFVNPDLKIYRGMERKLQIDCYQRDSLIASDFIDYNAGSVYNPIIVNGLTTFQVIMQGTLLGLLTIFWIYLFFQFILPAIRYIIFKRKYVTQYTNKNMTYNGVLVDQSCYFCKAPFVEGDSIVVKCQHVMHESCWDENEYKCPEYGRNCKTGSHYYNRHSLFDPRNASFYLSWILAGAFAGLIAWISFTANAHNNEGLSLVKLIHVIFDLDQNSTQTDTLMEEYGNHLFYLPFYGMNIGFFLTLSLSLLTGHGRWWWKRSLFVAVKSLVGGVCGYLSFFIGCVISISLNFKDNSFLIDWIPWMLSGFMIAFIVAYGTDIKLKKALIGAAISIVFGLGSMYLWSFAFSMQIDTREFLLLSYMIYCIGFAVSVAATSPKSERYFLRVEGPIKEMDVAIYKWMNASILSKRVTIGKSVNCDLQMSWDITSPIAPEQAEVRMINGYLYLFALEDGVIFDKKPLKPRVRKRLYHGSKFVIGKTIFTYIEKDL